MNKPVVYVASPYTASNDKLGAVRAQIDAGEALMRNGYAPILPLMSHYWHEIYPHHWSEWMDYCLSLVRKADALLRLPGDSVGADLEVEMAKELGIPVYQDETELLTFLVWNGREEADE